MNRRDRRAAAKASKVSRTAPSATTSAALYEAGVAHFVAGRYLEAQMCCAHSLALDADHADTLHLSGLICMQAGQHDHAIEWMSRAVRQQPKTDYLTNLGTALTKLGRREEALAVFDKAVRLSPDHPGVWKNLGHALSRLGQTEEAIRGFEQALRLNPDDWEAALRAGFLLREIGRTEQALACFDLHQKMPSDSGLKRQMRAAASFTRERFAEGLADIERAHALDPRDAGICNQLGMFLVRLGRENEALPWFDRALGRQPNFMDALNNKAFALTQLHRFPDALAVYEQMKTAGPDQAKAAFGASLVHLLTGNFEAGWTEREARWGIPGMAIAHFEFTQPKWLGKEPIDGKTILVFEDEGAGDTIQFVRYVPVLAARGARVILYVGSPLLSLLAAISGVSQCISTSVKELPPFDLQCPVSALPLAFATRLDTIPSGAGYLPQPEESRRQAWETRLRDRIGADGKLRVGLVWSGNPKHLNDRNRSIRLRVLLPLLNTGATFISLQKDPRPDDKILLEQTDIADFSPHLTDFAETAALISQLDLVITVDTSVAHLTGALGRPTWVLLPHLPDWRWLLDREDNPWYPSVRLFRQGASRDYADVVARVRGELVATIAARTSV